MTDISGLFLMKGRIHLIFIFLLYDLCQNVPYKEENMPKTQVERRNVRQGVPLIKWILTPVFFAQKTCLRNECIIGIKKKHVK